ncbi:hypothetical protein LJR255_004180 [Pararhizobium sp. LjRoot255]
MNFRDIGVRQGMAWTETSNPKVLGVEGAGRVLAIGADTDNQVERRPRYRSRIVRWQGRNRQAGRCRGRHRGYEGRIR